MRRAATVLFVVLGLVLLVFIVASAVLGRLATGALSSAQQKLAADWATYGAQVEADVALWKPHALLAPRDGGDAAALLSAHVRWDSLDGGGPAAPVSRELEQQLRAWGQAWPTHAGDAGVEGVDLTWMKELSQYGHWDLEPVGGPLDAVGFAPLYEPTPRFLDAMTLAKVRLLQGLGSGQPGAAAAEVRELARLALTTESLVGALTGVGLLGLERHAWDEARARGLDVTGWTPVSQADADRLKRVLWAAQASATLTATGPLAAAALPVGRCAALREGVGLAHFLRSHLEDELDERYAALSKALAEEPCRLRRARAAWASGTLEGRLPVTTKALCEVELGTGATACSLPDLSLSAVPFARRYIGSTLLSVAQPDWFKSYRAPAP